MGYREDLESGRAAFAHLIRHWHGRNGWSHRVLPALAEALDLGRVHNSQLSMLRNGKLASPGPEVFLALGRINRWLAQEAPDGTLPADAAARLLAAAPADLAEALALSAQPVREDSGRVLGPGDLLEVFVGLRPPPAAYDLSIEALEAPGLSAALALLFTAGRPWRLCREPLLAAYPGEKRQRRDRFAAVMAGQEDYTAVELEAELADLRRTLAALGAAGEKELSPEQFLALLRRRAAALGEGGEPGPPDLAGAIRSQLNDLA